MSELVGAAERREGAEEEEEDEAMDMSGEEDMGDDDDYEYTYADDDGDGDDDVILSSQSTRRQSTTVVFTGLDTIGNTNDMVLKKELTRLVPDIERNEKNKAWRLDLGWTEETRTLSLVLEHEGFIKAHINLTFPRSYPKEPPVFQYLGPRFDDTVDFVLGADVFEPCRKENWNDTFTCTHLVMIVMELVKDKYPITDQLVWDEYEQNLIKICRTRLPGIPRRVKDGMVYFGVRIEPKEKGSKRSSGIGYSSGGREAHDFSAHDAKFQEQVDALKRLLEISSDATSVSLSRLAHIQFGAWLLQYLEEELPIFKFEDVQPILRQAIEVIQRVDPGCEELARIMEVLKEREALIKPADGRLLASSTDFVISVEDEFERHNFKAEGSSGAPSLEVVKRIMLELENLKDNLRGMVDGQIFVVFSEATCLLWKVIIIPSSGTPYYGGCFEFHLAIPTNYPQQPPKCLFMTTGGGQVRFNPNLYNNGKVCLSLLGTWSGEPWDPAHSNLSQLLISILAFIFTTEPLKNEPGLEGTPDKSNAFYNAYIRLETVETAMLGMLQKPPTEFHEVIRRHFKRSWYRLIRPDLLDWAEKVSFEEADSTNGSHQCSGQIVRMQWYKTALGQGYRKSMLQLVARMDEVVDAIREFEADALLAGAGGGGQQLGGGDMMQDAKLPAAASSGASSGSEDAAAATGAAAAAPSGVSSGARGGSSSSGGGGEGGSGKGSAAAVGGGAPGRGHKST